ncbi:MAG: DUF2069 domain-containing protein [Porticoccaceae bacterium]|nr:DUF2069 domain-containing protein [Porticoccaceae bacterium]MDG1473448.1 DUF2069 domain-containing protein [Porticoccaceae bacterium]
MQIEKKIVLSKLITQISFSLLIVTQTVNLWMQSAPMVIYFFALLPLLILTPGIIQNQVRATIWLGFVLLLYFAIATYKVSAPEPIMLDVAELALIVILFTSAMMNARLRQKKSN